MITLLLAAFLSGNYDGGAWYYVGDHPQAVTDCLNEFGYHGDPQWAEQRIWAPKSQIRWCIKWNTEEGD